jgi:hypothetical protein
MMTSSPGLWLLVAAVLMIVRAIAAALVLSGEAQRTGRISSLEEFALFTELWWCAGAAVIVAAAIALAPFVSRCQARLSAAAIGLGKAVMYIVVAVGVVAALAAAIYNCFLNASLSR